MIKQPEPALLFLSYAHEDEPLRKELEKHLSLLQRQGHIRPWHDRQITPGSNWAKEIDSQLENASIILLLISSDFMASNYRYGVEMQRALQLHRAGKAQVIPIFLRPVDWQNAPFSNLRGLPRNGRPVTEWPDRDMAFRDIAQGLRQIIEGSPLSAPSAPIAPSPFPSSPTFSPINDTTQRGTSRRVAVIGLVGLIGIGIGALGLSFYHPSSSPTSPTTPIVPTAPTSNATAAPNTTPTASANTPTPASDAPTTSTIIATYNGMLTSQTVNQQSKMQLVITSQDQQGGTIEGNLKVDAPLASRSGYFSGSIDSNGNITEFIVNSTVSPALTFYVKSHSGNFYSGTYDGTTLDSSHDYTEAGIWQMTKS